MVRVATNKCHDRFCGPCAEEHRRVVCRNLRAALAGRDLRFMTLTLKSRERPLAATLGILAACWRRLRGVLTGKTRPLGGEAPPVCRMSGGVVFLELSLNPNTRCWHPHLHILYEGTYIPQAWLSKQWLAITTDSFIVDIRRLNDSNAAAGYVAKYAAKALSPNVVRDPDRLTEAVITLHGRRTFSTFGTWTGLDLSRSPDDDDGWEPLCPLWVLIADAAKGGQDALEILRKLRSSNHVDTADLLDLLPAGP